MPGDSASLAALVAIEKTYRFSIILLTTCNVIIAFTSTFVHWRTSVRNSRIHLLTSLLELASKQKGESFKLWEKASMQLLPKWAKKEAKQIQRIMEKIISEESDVDKSPKKE